MALQDRLDAFKSDFVSGRLPFKPSLDRLARMQRATDELIASGQAQRAKKAGDTAPDFIQVTDSEGSASNCFSQRPAPWLIGRSSSACSGGRPRAGNSADRLRVRLNC